MLNVIVVNSSMVMVGGVVSIYVVMVIRMFMCRMLNSSIMCWVLE